MFPIPCHAIILNIGTTGILDHRSTHLTGIQFVLIVLITMVVVILIRRNLPEFTSVQEPLLSPGDGESPKVPDAVLWQRSLARSKVEVPSLFLMGMGAINLIMGAVLSARTVQMANKPIAEFEQEYQEARDLTSKFLPNADRLLEDQQWDAKTALRQAILVNLGSSGILLLGSWLMGMGGWRMRRLESFPLAMAGSLFCAIPCLSCGGCFGLGQLVSVWSVIVLLDPIVRTAFLNHNPLKPPD